MKYRIFSAATLALLAFQGLAAELKLDANILLLTDKDADSPYVFTDAREALRHVNEAAAGTVTLYVSPSVYWLDDPDDPAIRRNSNDTNSAPFAVEVECDTLNIIGLSATPEDVVFAVNRGQTQGALGNYTMFHFKGKSLRTENITFGNYCNVDLVYPRDPSKNRSKRRDAIVQAQLGICEGTDRLFARNCRFISRLNLCPFVGARRSLYKDCYFECTDDALSGSGVYLDCKFTFHSGKPFYSTASTGAVFMNCDIHTLTDGTQYFTKMPGQMTAIDCRFTSDTPVQLRWSRDESRFRCYQSNITLNGVPVMIDSDRQNLWVDITEKPLLNAYKIKVDDKVIYNTPNLLGGEDGWDPLEVKDAILEAEKGHGRSYLGLPVSLKVEATKKSMEAKGDTISLAAVPRLWGDYPSSMTNDSYYWTSPDVVSLMKDGETTKGVSANRFPMAADVFISAINEYGLAGATNVSLPPYLLPAPSVVSAPEIKALNNNLTLSYALDRDADDDSYIIWYRSGRPDLTDSIAVSHGRGVSARSYPLTAADRGYYISASVFPKFHDTATGAPVLATLNAKVNKTPKEINSLSTNFSDIPIRGTEPGKQGFWHFDVYKPADTAQHNWEPRPGEGWYYGRGEDAATGVGLVQSTKGARLSYTPVRQSCKEMNLSLVAEPAKGPGQGFGSATGQYMDICVKFDPVTLTGYALRIERKPDYDKSVTFTLVKYSSGEVTPVSEIVASNCFRTPCHINLSIKDGLLTASAMTGAPAVSALPAGVQPSVSLSANVDAVPGVSFAIQHTGSVGSSATLLRDLDVTWK